LLASFALKNSQSSIIHYWSHWRSTTDVCTFRLHTYMCDLS